MPQYQPYSQIPFNPMQNPQQRLQNMEQLYQQNGYPQPMMNQQGYLMQQIPQQQVQQPQFVAQQTPVLKGRAVTSIDEVRGSMIDLDGSLFVFPDLGNKKIHTKQINLDGTATISTYVLEKPVVSAVSEVPPQDVNLPIKIYAEKDELEQVVKTLSQQIDDLKKEISDTKMMRQNNPQNQRGGNNNA